MMIESGNIHIVIYIHKILNHSYYIIDSIISIIYNTSFNRMMKSFNASNNEDSSRSSSSKSSQKRKVADFSEGPEKKKPKGGKSSRVSIFTVNILLSILYKMFYY